MSNLIAKVRLEVLRKNLEETKCISHAVSKRREDISAFSNIFSGVADSLSTLRYKAPAYKNDAEELQNERLGLQDKEKKLAGLITGLGELEEQVNKIVTNVNEAATILNRMNARLVQINTNFRSIVEYELEVKASEWIRDLSSLETALKEKNQPGINTLMQQAWREDISQPIFSEYVNILSGLALRDTGFDQDICTIADDLIRNCGQLGYTKWESMIIPSGQGALTLARIIRMGFPEWTLWALPLTAHELGQVMVMVKETKINDYLVRESNLMRKALEEKTKTALCPAETKHLEKRIQICMADAFATCAMGPAYVCALLLLRLNPLSAYVNHDDQPQDAERAHIALHMLQLMSGTGPVQEDYQDLITILDDEWKAALAQAGGANGGAAAAAEPPLDEKQKEWDDFIWKKQEEWAGFIWDTLKDDTRGSYSGKLWTSTKNALKNLIEKPNVLWYSTEKRLEELKKSDGPNGADIQDIKVEGSEEWRDVLNAAWGYRIEQLSKEGEAVKAEAIAEGARRLKTLIDHKKQENISRSSGGGYGRGFGSPPSITGGKRW